MRTPMPVLVTAVVFEPCIKAHRDFLTPLDQWQRELKLHTLCFYLLVPSSGLRLVSTFSLW